MLDAKFLPDPLRRRAVLQGLLVHRAIGFALAATPPPIRQKLRPSDSVIAVSSNNW
jgi:hypothetical protein